MKLTVDDALDLLKVAEKTTTHLGWIKHSICVGNTWMLIKRKL